MLGQDISRNIKSLGMDSISMAAYTKGIEDGMTGEDPLFDEQEIRQTLQAHFQELQQAKVQVDMQNAEPKKAEGEAFLAQNKTKEGVITLPSGLQYEVINEGSGASPSLTDVVETHYHGTFRDGSVFDSSVDRGQPAKFPVNGVISAWTEALQLMKVGSKWKLYCPYDLAYGAKGNGSIGPYEALIFEVELLSIGE
ncbi:MAG: FKBP-type peptidyl-prolyl cis-trans isomerase [Bacteroidetes bacterium]|nr:FKBP-type peptidyl-prolyl cis-trans isomerase [Bacteroidota bacterium]